MSQKVTLKEFLQSKGAFERFSANFQKAIENPECRCLDVGCQQLNSVEEFCEQNAHKLNAILFAFDWECDSEPHSGSFWNKLDDEFFELQDQVVC